MTPSGEREMAVLGVESCAVRLWCPLQQHCWVLQEGGQGAGALLPCRFPVSWRGEALCALPTGLAEHQIPLLLFVHHILGLSGFGL